METGRSFCAVAMDTIQILRKRRLLVVWNESNMQIALKTGPEGVSRILKISRSLCLNLKKIIYTSFFNLDREINIKNILLLTFALIWEYIFTTK